MAVFQFKAKTMQGKLIKGELNADNESDARVKIRAQHLVPIQVQVKGQKGAAASGAKIQKYKVKNKELIIFTRQFSVLISSGVPIVQSIEAMAKGAKSPALISVLSQITEMVNHGRRLAEAMGQFPTVFDRMYINLIKAGEEGGVLDEILNKLALHMEKSGKLRGKIIGALIYPAVIILVAILVISAILVFVIPSFVEMFSQSGKELPWLTTKVIEVSNLMVKYWYIILAVPIVGIFGLKEYYKTPDGRKQMDQVFINIPILGTLIQKGSIARFSRTLATLLGAGVRINECLEISAATSGNWVIESALLKAKDSINKGRNLVEPLKKESQIPQMVAQMMEIGEQTGSLDIMLTKIADFFEDEVETAAAALTSVIEPMLMVVLGGIIAVLVIAMYLPIFNLAGSVG